MMYCFPLTSAPIARMKHSTEWNHVLNAQRMEAQHTACIAYRKGKRHGRETHIMNPDIADRANSNGNTTNRDMGSRMNKMSCDLYLLNRRWRGVLHSCPKALRLFLRASPSRAAPARYICMTGRLLTGGELALVCEVETRCDEDRRGRSRA